MGTLEASSKVKTRKKNIRKFVLQAVATAGVLSVAAVAPGVVGAMAKLGIIPTKRHKEIVKRSRQKLVEQGLLEYKNQHLRLTGRGKVALRLISAEDFKLAKPKRWDKKWRVLIFDIKESRRALRNKIRNTLVAIGFVRLQHSVWIYPYDCEDLITLLKADFKVGKDILYMIVDELEYDSPLRKRFGLPEQH